MVWWQKLILVLISILPGIFLFGFIVGIKMRWEWLIDEYPYDDEM